MPINIPHKQIVKLLDNLLDGYEPGTELLPLGLCSGRVLAGDVAAGEDIPGFDRSAVEGFALRARDTAGATVAAPAMLQLLGGGQTAIAGGQCAHLLPGEPIPAGADCVANVNVSLMLGTDTGRVFIEQQQRAGAGIIPQRRELHRGQIVLKKGTLLGGGHIALLAAMGISLAPVLTMPQVAVMALGSQLVDAEQDADGYRLRDMATPMLEAELRGINALPRNLGVVSEDGLADALADEGADIFVVSGNSLNRAMEELGADEIGYLEIQGAAMGIYSQNGRLILLLPGHPAQAYFFFKLLCQPILQGMCGATTSFMAVQAVLDSLPPFCQGYSYIPVSIRAEGSKYTAIPFDMINCTISNILKLEGYAIMDPDAQAGQMVSVVIF